MSLDISMIISKDKIVVDLELRMILKFNYCMISNGFIGFSLTKNVRSCLDGMYFVDTTNYIIVVETDAIVNVSLVLMYCC